MKFLFVISIIEFIWVLFNENSNSLSLSLSLSLFLIFSDKLTSFYFKLFRQKNLLASIEESSMLFLQSS
ncbi:hypothetical protein ACMBCM_05785, partial [Spiroplasma sp. K1]